MQLVMQLHSFIKKEIDRINILNASIHAMHLAIEKLKIKPEYILVDGNRFHLLKKIPYKCIIRGDGKYQNIAAASILAKTTEMNTWKKLDSLSLSINGIITKDIQPTNIERQLKNMVQLNITENHLNCYPIRLYNF